MSFFFIGCYYEILFHWLSWVPFLTVIIWNEFLLIAIHGFPLKSLSLIPFLGWLSWICSFLLAVMGSFYWLPLSFFYRLLWVSFLWAVLNSSFFGPLPGLRNFFLTIHLHLLCLVYCSWQARVFPDKIVLIILKSIPNFVLLFIFF